MTKLVARGACAGALGGVASALFLLILGERSIRAAIAIEEAAAGAVGEPAEFSRGTQTVAGAIAVVVIGALLGMVFSVVFARVRHYSRVGDDLGRSLGLAAIAFVVIVLVPFLKYPANPPAVGNSDTVETRTAAYLGLIAASVLVATMAWSTSRLLRANGWSDATRLSVIGTGAIVLLSLAYLLLPGGTDPGTIPADLLWRFRIASLGGWAALWAVVGLSFGWMSVRAAHGQPRSRAREAVPA